MLSAVALTLLGWQKPPFLFLGVEIQHLCPEMWSIIVYRDVYTFMLGVGRWEKEAPGESKFA